jgi:hypothetical protein
VKAIGSATESVVADIRPRRLPNQHQRDQSTKRIPAGGRAISFAEPAAKEIVRVNLVDALELTILIARKDPRRHPRVAAALAAALPRGASGDDDR